MMQKSDRHVIFKYIGVSDSVLFSENVTEKAKEKYLSGDKQREA
ncbi:hypothetical protein [Vibrio spartinae]|nr:hypothetical protein [Vibrio spartinae]